MILHVLRALFILLMASVGWTFLQREHGPFGDLNWLCLMASLAFGVFVVIVDILAPRKKLTILSGTFLGLIVGLATSYALSYVVPFIADPYITSLDNDTRTSLILFMDMALRITCCYLAISFILQTKDDFRFIIPYVEFRKQTKGSRPILLDTSVLIDGRITDIAETGILDSQLIAPRFVLRELQTIADSSDKLKRNRGRRGLDILTQLQHNKRVEVILYDSSGHDEQETDVDQKLLSLSKLLDARILTNDFNLNKVAQLRGVDVININDLGNALKPVVIPGERMNVILVKAGEQPGQGIGYLDDGTMIVVEQGRPYLNNEVEFTVTSVVQTSAGRMIFGRIADASLSRTPQIANRKS